MPELSAEEAYKAGIRDVSAARARVRSLVRLKLISREAAKGQIVEELNRRWQDRVRTGELPPLFPEHVR